MSLNPRVAHKLMSVLAEVRETSGKSMPDSLQSAVSSLESEVKSCLHGGSSSYDGESGESKPDNEGTEPSFEKAKEKTKERFQKARQDDSTDDSKSV